MLQFTLVTEKRWEGVDASIPSIPECESWAKTEEEAIEALLERLAFFLQKEKGFRHDIDYMRREEGQVFYKLIIREGG